MGSTHCSQVRVISGSILLVVISELALIIICTDDGQFWLTKEEFFKYFPTIFLCTHDMRKFAGEWSKRDAVSGVRATPAATRVSRQTADGMCRSKAPAAPQPMQKDIWLQADPKR